MTVTPGAAIAAMARGPIQVSAVAPTRVLVGMYVIEAIAQEKRIKKWHRDWKVNLIQAMNPCWDDLYDTIIDVPFD
ncbi:MAG: hypothetical protein ACM3X5_03230 [Bacillota bacterium]